MKKQNDIAALILEFNQLALTQYPGDLRDQHTDASNDQQTAKMRDLGSAVQGKHHRALENHRKALRHHSS